MAHDSSRPDYAAGRAVRDLADRYVASLVELDPLVAAIAGLRPGDDRVPDLSPAGAAAEVELARRTLAELASVTAAGPPGDPDERRCAGLMRAQLDAVVAGYEAGEHLRAVQTVTGPTPRACGSC